MADMPANGPDMAAIAEMAERNAIEAERWRWVHENATLSIEHGSTAFTLRIDTGVQPHWKGDVDDVIDAAIAALSADQQKGEQ
jgi:hypothetical protein